MMPRLALIPLIATILFASSAVAATATTITGAARISDGDTITVKGTKSVGPIGS